MKIAAQTAQIPINIGCFAHTLHLASGRALDLKEVHQVLAKMRSVVSLMHRSTTASALLNKKQKMLQLPENKLLIDVRTSWNSSYLMVERFLEQQVTILATLTDDTIRKQPEAKLIQANCVLPNEVRHCEDFLSLMEPLYQATVSLSADHYPTVGLMLPVLKKLKGVYLPEDSDTPFKQKIKQAILKDLEKRYLGENLVEYLEEATVLDPRVKGKAPPAAWERLRDKLIALPVKQELMHVKSEPAESSASDEPALPQLPKPHASSQPELPKVPDLLQTGVATEIKTETPYPVKQRKKSALSFLLDDDEIQISKVEPPLSKQELVNKEISIYREEAKLGSRSNPLQYWKTNALKFPFLSRLVKSYLCTQGSSVASERVFSTAGDIVTATRSCLEPEHVDQLIFLKKNFNEAKDMAIILHNM
ncbi:E3 SUMO-protein ligase ZBED1-like [Mercenaria mercenaria]|uniref:E3 SUMO-protein ligase ZBED1-like n=1 Tax=Mercenaria mercenaria TaxID=6596 RepID=UPI00234FACD9|nr:E3 SUMO-protein ligase ZBED1-like [Mercenaria mercenaria]